jgi:serine/threonine protein phosphatase PrpC
VNVKLGAKTDVGLVRQGNEDSYLVDDPLFVVADGMGGHVAGDVASSTAVDVISGEARSADPTRPETLAAIVQHANSAIWKKSQDDPALHGMGTTCTMVVIGDHMARFAHVGDSRAYILRDEELSQLTEDHTLVHRMVREGKISAEDADHHPQRNIVTRALGVDPHVEVDTFSVELNNGDRILVCSDGLNSMVAGTTIRDVLIDETDPQAAADRLVQLAIDGGGEDNITVLVLEFAEAGQRASPTDDDTAARPRVTGGAPAGEDAESPQATQAPDGRNASGASDTMMGARPSDPVVRSSTPPASGTDFRSGVLRRDVMEPRKRWPRRVAVTLVILIVLGTGGFFVVRNLLSNAYFVGVDEGGMVTIYRGIPDEIAGINLSDEETTTDLALEDLPTFMRDDVEEGIKADSLQDAEETVNNLEDRAEGFGEQESPQRPDRPGSGRQRDEKNNG